MDKQTECSIIQDILPNYLEKMTSEKTNEFIEKHIENCERCQNKKTKMMEETEENTAPPKEIDYMKKVRGKLSFFRKIVIIITIILTILFLVFLFSNVRKLVILFNLSTLANTTADTTNYSYEIVTYKVGDTKIAKAKSYCKDNIYLKTSIIYQETENIMKMTLYDNGKEKIGLLDVGNKKYSTINGINSGNITITGSKTKLNEMGLYSAQDFLSPYEIFSLKITSDTCNSKESYLLQTKEGVKCWIDKQTGIIIRYMDFNQVMDYAYKINTVTQEDVKQPDTTGYTIEN